MNRRRDQAWRRAVGWPGTPRWDREVAAGAFANRMPRAALSLDAVRAAAARLPRPPATRGTYAGDATITLNGQVLGNGWAEAPAPAPVRPAPRPGPTSAKLSITSNSGELLRALRDIERGFREASIPRWEREVARDAEAIAEGRVRLLAWHLERAGVDAGASLVPLLLRVVRRDLVDYGPLSETADRSLAATWQLFVPAPPAFDVVDGEVRQLSGDEAVARLLTFAA